MAKRETKERLERLEIITGTMFAGNTERLFDRIAELEGVLARKRR